MKKINIPQRTKKIIIGFTIAVLAFAAIWGVQWATYARPPLSEAINALDSDDRVTITHEPWLTFTPIEDFLKIGFIFYPGGRVDPRAYASLARTIAEEGYLVVIPEMPINMAVFNPDAADEIIAFYTDIDHWVIGGHSVGGTMAVRYTDKNPETIAGLAIWASYPANSNDISDMDIPVISIYGSREVIVTDASVGKRAHLLPIDTQYIRNEGGDHHQFGSYQINPKDHLATIIRECQHEQIIQATLDLLAETHN